MKVFSILQGLCLLLFLWQTSIAIVFQEKIFTSSFVMLGVLEAVIVFTKALIINIDEHLSREDLKVKLEKSLISLLVLACSLAMVGRNSLELNGLNILIDLAVLVVSLFLARKVSKYFRAIKTYA